MKDILVIGVGNRLMMDDGIGVHVVEELKERSTNPGIRYIVGETDIYYCLDQIEEASYIIIVDAACFNKEPGTISKIPLLPVLKNRMLPTSVHDSNLLYEIMPGSKGSDGVFIGIEPAEVNYCPNLSKNLQEQFISIVEGIEDIIASITC